MNDRGAYPLACAPKSPSLLIESLVWNVPDHRLGHATYTDEVHAVLSFLIAGV